MSLVASFYSSYPCRNTTGIGGVFVFNKFVIFLGSDMCYSDVTEN